MQTTCTDTHTSSIEEKENLLETTLEQYDAFIIMLARNALRHYENKPEIVEMEIDEIAQMTRIKLWSALTQTHIIDFKAYIRRIVHNETINLLRRRKHETLLPIDEEGEITSGVLLMNAHRGEDPAQHVMQNEELLQYIQMTAECLLTLPPFQRRAIMYDLVQKLGETSPLVSLLAERGCRVEVAAWPKDTQSQQRLRASLSIARKNLRSRQAKHNRYLTQATCAG